MRIVEFQPGDGTMYHVGIMHVPVESSAPLGWGKDQDCTLFYFGTDAGECGQVFPARLLFPRDITRRMPMVEGYNAGAAAIVYAFLLGIEADLTRDKTMARVLGRWDNAGAHYIPWRVQLSGIQLIFQREFSGPAVGSIVTVVHDDWAGSKPDDIGRGGFLVAGDSSMHDTVLVGLWPSTSGESPQGPRLIGAPANCFEFEQKPVTKSLEELEADEARHLEAIRRQA